VWEIAMNTAPFAPRTIAGARTERSRSLALPLRNLRRRIASAMVDGCASFARAWQHHEELMDMLHLDDRLLADIGVRRSEILAAVKERRWTCATWRLVATAVTRRQEAGAVDARTRMYPRRQWRAGAGAAVRPSEAHHGNRQRRAA
jgi:hypothetical protein